MSESFRGTVNIDVRDSVPDWEPYVQPVAPDGAQNVLYIVLDDVGYSAMEPWGGLIETPNINRLADGNGHIPFECATIAEVLGERGWNTYMLGKWHLCPADEVNMPSTKRNWPVGRGFERFYGFLGGETNQWYPDLIYDNHPVEQPGSRAARTSARRTTACATDLRRGRGRRSIQPRATSASAAWSGTHRELASPRAIQRMRRTRSMAPSLTW